MRILSNWRSVRLWETQVEHELRRDYDLRTHGLLIGSFTLLLMWAVSHLQMRLGVHSLALRYFVTLGVGYLAYLAVLRWWAQRLVANDTYLDPDLPDGPDGPDASGDESFSVYTAPVNIDAGGSGGAGLGDLASLDNGAVIVIPVIAIFLIGSAIVLGAGALALLYFGWDALLAVAVEVAFSYVSARAAVRLARAGWLTVAVRLTWKPLLGALLCAVVLGAVLDHFVPQAESLPEALRIIMRKH